MIFNQSNRDDISRYYRKTYVKFPETGEKLHFIREIAQHAVLGSDEDGNDFELFLSDEFPYEVDYVLPKKGYFQHGKAAHLLFRVPAKQYQRGLSEGNTKVHRINRAGEISEQPLTFDLLKAYVQKQAYPSFEIAMANKEGMFSVALSQRFALAAAARTLFVDGYACAVVKPKEKVVECRFPILRPEIEEIVKQSSYKVA